MSRLAPALAALALSLVACAQPVIRLTPVYAPGEERVYLLSAEVTSTLDTGGQRRVERSQIDGRSTMRVKAVEGDEATIELTLAFDRFLRNGRPERYDPQTAEVIVSGDGSVRRVQEVGGLPPEVTGVNVEGFARRLSVALPPQSLRLGQRWREQAPDESRAGRLRALRVVDGRDCAVASVTTVRSVNRLSEDAGEQVALGGTETTQSEVVFAFRDGFPVSVRSDTEGRFDIASPSLGGGSLRILSRSTMTLSSRSA